jgi:hypothetical protein
MTLIYLTIWFRINNNIINNIKTGKELPVFFIISKSSCLTQKKQKMNKVVVTANAEGKVVVVSENNPEFGYIRVTQSRQIFDEATGFVKTKEVGALVLGTVADLNSLGWRKGQELDGKIITKEQLKPFNNKNADRDYKVAGETQIVCCVDGEPIYARNIYTGNAKAEDVRIQHTNVDEIREAFAALKAQEKDLNP